MVYPRYGENKRVKLPYTNFWVDGGLGIFLMGIGMGLGNWLVIPGLENFSEKGSFKTGLAHIFFTLPFYYPI